MEMMGLSEKSYRNGALCSPPHPHIFSFLLPSPSSLSSSSSSSLSCLPSQLNSPVCSSSLEHQQSPSLKVLTHTFSAQPMCLWMTLPGQEQWSNFSFLPELTTALAVAAALFSSWERGCKENWSKLGASPPHSHSLMCKHNTRHIPGTYKISQ